MRQALVAKRIVTSSVVLGGIFALAVLVTLLGRSPHSEAGTEPQTCEVAIDLMLVLDGSGSIHDNPAPDNEWATLKAFAVNLVNEFAISTLGTHIGVVQFSSTTHLEIGLSDSQANVVNAINNMIQLKTLTNIAGGVNAGQAEFNLHGRPGVPHIMLVVTDGNQTVAGDPLAAANAARALGTEIFAIGVGNGVNVEELNNVGNDPDIDHVFFVTDFTQLVNILDTVVENSCPPTPTPTNTSAATATPTNTLTSTPTNTPTNTPTDTPTNTPTDTPTNTPTDTPTNTPTDTPTNTPTDTPTNTPTDTPTNTPTDTPTNTPTDTPTNTPTDTPTETPTETPTDTPTNTPTETLTPTQTPIKADSDGDGCPDVRELAPKSFATLGGGRDPNNYWDWFDTPNPNANPQRDRAITIDDLFRVLERYALVGDGTIDPRTTPPKTGYHPAYDRSYGGANNWNMGPANGVIDIDDIYLLASQFAHFCKLNASERAALGGGSGASDGWTNGLF